MKIRIKENSNPDIFVTNVFNAGYDLRRIVDDENVYLIIDIPEEDIEFIEKNKSYEVTLRDIEDVNEVALFLYYSGSRIYLPYDKHQICFIFDSFGTWIEGGTPNE